MDGEAWQATVWEVAESRTQLRTHTRWGIPESVRGLLTPRKEKQPGHSETDVEMSPSHSKLDSASSVSFISFRRVLLR